MRNVCLKIKRLLRRFKHTFYLTFFKGFNEYTFFCSKNKWRSPTAEYLYKNHTTLKVRSAGISSSARKLINITDIGWADSIFVMENKHKQYINEHFRDQLGDKTLIVLDIPDDYQYMDEELVAWLTDSINAHLNL